MGVISIVRRKMDNARFSAMLALFMRRTCSVECQRVARLVGNVDDDPEQFDVQTEEEFKKLLKIQGDAEFTTIIVEKLRSKGRALDSSELEPQGMDGTNIEQLCTFFHLFDANGDGEVNLDEFRIMVRTSRQAATLFTGSEDLGHLSAKQMEALLIYDQWPTQHQGPGDTGTQACLCMFRGACAHVLA
jgi:Ca2+-binding EF-hand superfamily protein